MSDWFHFLSNLFFGIMNILLFPESTPNVIVGLMCLACAIWYAWCMKYGTKLKS